MNLAAQTEGGKVCREKKMIRIKEIHLGIEKKRWIHKSLTKNLIVKNSCIVAI